MVLPTDTDTLGEKDPNRKKQPKAEDEDPEERIRRKHEQFFATLGSTQHITRNKQQVVFHEVVLKDPEPPEKWTSVSNGNSQSSSSADYGTFSTWVNRFVEKFPSLLKIPNEFFQENFSLYGLDTIFGKKYRTLLSLMTDRNARDAVRVTQDDCAQFYCVIHQRYIHSQDGVVRTMYKRREGAYGHCMRALCYKTPLLPVQKTKTFEAAGYCSRCGQLFIVDALKEEKIPYLGLAFGRSFPEFFLMNHPEQRPLEDAVEYVPKIFGYKLKNKKLVGRLESPVEMPSDSEESEGISLFANPLILPNKKKSGKNQEESDDLSSDESGVKDPFAVSTKDARDLPHAKRKRIKSPCKPGPVPQAAQQHKLF